MTATERLRELLDERGVEWETDRSGFRVMWGRPVDEFHDTMEFKAVDNALPNGGLNVHICGATPEQAIAATLGPGTCRIIEAELDDEGCKLLTIEPYPDATSKDEWYGIMGVCSGCGEYVPKMNYCPNCGRRCVG